MRAVVFRKPGEAIAIEEMPEPQPGIGEMVIEVGRCGICGSDATLTEHEGIYQHHSVLGHEYAGTVVAIGKEVEGFAIGDLVTAMPMAGCGNCSGCSTGNPLLCETGIVQYAGGFARYTKVASRSTIKLPAHLSAADGALVEPLAVGLTGVTRANVQGGRILVLGAGAIGLAATYWARQLGADSVVNVARSLRQQALVDNLGGNALLQAGEDLPARVRTVLGGLPDIVVEAIGTTGALQASADLVRPGGTVVSLGFCMHPDALNVSFASFRQLNFLFSMGYTLQNFQRAADSLSAGKVEPRCMIGATIGLDAVPAAIDAMRAGLNPHTRILVDPTMA
jgi:threonine dehydrogenase-like Zn-dependent dehydrogenase